VNNIFKIQARIQNRIRVKLRDGFKVEDILCEERAILDAFADSSTKMRGRVEILRRNIDKALIDEGILTPGNTLWGVGAEPVNYQAACLLFTSKDQVS
jgi:hypothetical protein